MRLIIEFLFVVFCDLFVFVCLFCFVVRCFGGDSFILTIFGVGREGFAMLGRGIGFCVLCCCLFVVVCIEVLIVSFKFFCLSILFVFVFVLFFMRYVSVFLRIFVLVFFVSFF